MRDRNRGIRRAAWLALLVGVVAVIAVVASNTNTPGHRLVVTVPDATNVIPGQLVKDAGVNVGEVSGLTAVNDGHAARVTMTINDSSWPLPQGTKLQLRWGGTVSFVNRYILMTRGPAGAPPMATDGVFPAADFSTPVEFDSLLGTFTRGVRANLKTFLGNAGVTLRDASPNLRRAIEAAPPALAQTAGVLGDLDSNEAALNSLVRSGAQVVDSVNRSDPGIQPLVTDTATTLAALASRTQQLDSTLATAPSMFAQTRTTLADAEPTLKLAKTVTGRIAPGVDQVNRIAGPLDDLLVTLRQVGPDAISALDAVRAATPSLNPALVKATAQMPQIQSISRQGVTSLDCIRPYTPDIVAFTSDWGDFLSGVDGKDHYFRAQVQTLLPATYNAQTYDSATMKKLFPWVSYVYPPPPGYAAGEPWFLPQCNEGPSTLNANQDPENNGAAQELPSANATPISLPEAVSR
ncbi:MAG TPA: MlaD family protein [Solirubrobacteraceae bacterium]|nr:MlaD family protein [Solirubrobacteraceae bacterium]